MVTRKDAIKKLSAIGSATLLVGTMIMGTSITAYAEFDDPNPEFGEIILINDGEVLGENYGTVYGNFGTVTENHDDGTIVTNHETGIVKTNDVDGYVSQNYGEVTDNYGSVKVNGGLVVNNFETGSVKENSGNVVTNNGDIYKNNKTTTENNGYIEKNLGLVDTNNGDIKENSSPFNGFNPVVNTNNGEIVTNSGEVKDNSNLITTNKGKVGENNETIITNFGTVVLNNGAIEENIGIVEDNQGSILRNYSKSDIGIKSGKAAEHQYWYVSIDGSWYSQGIDVSFVKDGSFVENSYYTDCYLEQDTDKQGTIRISPREEGYKIALGSGTQSVTTCQVELVQDGNDYLVKISSITGVSNLTLAQLNLVVQAIQQGGGGASGGGAPSGGNITIVLDESVSLATDNGGSSGESAQNAITVSQPIATAYAAIGTNGPSVLGANREASRTLSFKMSAITDAQYKNAVIANIGATPAGGVLRIQTDTIACFDRAMLEAFAKKGSITMEVLFPVGKTMMKVTIPAGFAIDNLLDRKGYCGFLNLLGIIGGEEVTR
ncbi:hypothetical protein SAMN02745247_02808 [Butyrivibrio hungatei DSM 14810]|uniref:Uncharacterized protein n=1 Tax=Butyrivibrio hungatei DSM 14810 TaxID=1121132 RepID=A0A1M7T185_9FIRM|nr:hypothetical protein [Butyrivibrio hungatei]SHN64523.1 hypothetical protein SAMN02745247_02808 [Butyrivibrio hungatei DSM 14810]